MSRLITVCTVHCLTFLPSLLTAFFEIKNAEKNVLFTQEVVAGASGHGPVHLLVQSVGAIVFA